MKRLFDFGVSLIALAFLAIPLGLVGLIIQLKLGSPIFFRQIRPGLNAQPFEMIKFRTMTDECDADGNLLSDRKRQTSLGRFLRATSLDELPGLWNVLQGDMSLVGPRPLLMDYLPLYNNEQMRRHIVRPGITGWAQVNGRNAISWEEKFRLDLWYVEHQSFWLDMCIIWKTMCRVVMRHGISAEGEVTMPRFKGTGT